MTRVLLVTGSRSLATIPGAEAWAREHIRRALEGVSLLIVGDAPGPDAWALDVSADFAMVPWRFCVYGDDAGWIVTERNSVRSRVAEWTPGKPEPLHRNAVMVQTARWHMLRGHDVRCLALLDGTKRDAPGRRATRGTEHTAALAERAGILVERRTWAREVRP